MTDPFLGRRLIAATRLARWEAKVAGAQQRVLDRRRDAVLSVIGATAQLTAAIPPDPFDLSSWDDELADEVVPELDSIFVEVADAITRRFIGQPGALLNLDMTTRLDRMVGVMSGVGPDTATALGHTLTVGSNLGETIAELAARVSEVFDAASSRAERIARTEVVGASNGASMDVATAVAQAGYALDKVWLATGDDRTRPTHADADGQRVAIDQPFDVGGVSLMYPGDPDCPEPGEVVNCRCVPVYEDAGGETVAEDTLVPDDGGAE